MESDDDKLSPLAAVQDELARANRKVLLDDQLLDALRSFEQIMGYRNEMYLRLSQRVRTTVRGGMAVFAMVGLAMFLLLITLVMQVGHARNSSSLLAQHVTAVAVDMGRIEATVRDMEGRMEKFDSISGYMHVMRDHTGHIAGGMQQLDTSMAAIRGQMTSINNRLLRINGHVGAMGYAVNGMGHSMGEVARPAGMFP
ncbi:MAG: hypothetical protein R3308_09485 [Thiohalobacterales bacterium]|nr:hypothetical protein [Thiohalobacterales bacterium]